MKSTSRLSVLSDRIPRVLAFVYFCRGLSGNTEERPTRRDYIEILTCRTIILHLEDSRSHETEAEIKRGQRQRTRPVPLGAHPPAEANQNSVSWEISTDLKDQSKPYNLSRFDPTAHIHLMGLYNQTPWPLEEAPLDHYSLFIDRAKARVQR